MFKNIIATQATMETSEVSTGHCWVKKNKDQKSAFIGIFMKKNREFSVFYVFRIKINI